MRASQPYERVLGRARRCRAPNGFPGARLNYAEHALRHERDGADALLYLSEREASEVAVLDRARRAGAQTRDRLRALGLRLRRSRGRLSAEFARGRHCDAGHGQHRRHLGELRSGFWCARRGRPVFAAGAEAGVLRRRLLLRRQSLRSPPRTRSIFSALPTLERVIYLRQLEPANDHADARTRSSWEEALAGRRSRARHSVFEQVPFAHPLWILFSSGTTGLPKPIMHCHGGMTLEQYKALQFHMDVHRARAHVLLHHHRLDDVEFPGQRAAGRCGAGAVRRQSGLSRARRAVAHGGAHAARASSVPARPMSSILEKAGIVPKERFDLSLAQFRDAGRLAGDRRMHGLVLPQRQGGCLGALGQRRHRSVHAASSAGW